jgi:hypothetical protein
MEAGVADAVVEQFRIDARLVDRIARHRDDRNLCAGAFDREFYDRAFVAA